MKISTLLTAAALSIAAVTSAHAKDIKIGDVFESQGYRSFTSMYDIGNNEMCGIANGTTVTVIEVDDDNVLVTTNNNTEGFFSNCPANEVLKTEAYTLKSFQEIREYQEIEAASIKKMLDRLTEKAAKAE